MVKKIIWPLPVQKQLKEIYKFILTRSPQNAEKVKTDILSAGNKLATNAEVHSPDKYRINNDGSFRAFELHHYRIAYHIGYNEITVVSVRHTKGTPKKY